jgi:hypothetical protein
LLTRRKSGPGQSNKLLSDNTTHDLSESKPSDVFMADGNSSATSGFVGGVCVTGTTTTFFWPSRSVEARMIAQGLSLLPSSRPAAASFDQR